MGGVDFEIEYDKALKEIVKALTILIRENERCKLEGLGIEVSVTLNEWQSLYSIDFDSHQSRMTNNFKKLVEERESIEEDFFQSLENIFTSYVSLFFREMIDPKLISNIRHSVNNYWFKNQRMTSLDSKYCYYYSLKEVLNPEQKFSLICIKNKVSSDTTMLFSVFTSFGHSYFLDKFVFIYDHYFHLVNRIRALNPKKDYHKLHYALMFRYAQDANEYEEFDNSPIGKAKRIKKALQDFGLDYSLKAFQDKYNELSVKKRGKIISIEDINKTIELLNKHGFAEAVTRAEKERETHKM
jgi:hypothetical protein